MTHGDGNATVGENMDDDIGSEQFLKELEQIEQELLAIEERKRWIRKRREELMAAAKRNKNTRGENK